jgi:hypothetical protein
VFTSVTLFSHYIFVLPRLISALTFCSVVTDPLSLLLFIPVKSGLFSLRRKLYPKHTWNLKIKTHSLEGKIPPDWDLGIIAKKKKYIFRYSIYISSSSAYKDITPCLCKLLFANDLFNVKKPQAHCGKSR